MHSNEDHREDQEARGRGQEDFHLKVSTVMRLSKRGHIF